MKESLLQITKQIVDAIGIEVVKFQVYEENDTLPEILEDIVFQSEYIVCVWINNDDKEIAKVLVCADFNEIDKERHLKQLAESVGKRLGKSSGSISRTEIIADVITRTLPQNLNYKESMEKNIELVNNAQKGLNNELTKAKIKNQSKSNGKENFKGKTGSGHDERD